MWLSLGIVFLFIVFGFLGGMIVARIAFDKKYVQGLAERISNLKSDLRALEKSLDFDLSSKEKKKYAEADVWHRAFFSPPQKKCKKIDAIYEYLKLRYQRDKIINETKEIEAHAYCIKKFEAQHMGEIVLPKEIGKAIKMGKERKPPKVKKPRTRGGKKDERTSA